jgi:hypothetical protein
MRKAFRSCTTLAVTAWLAMSATVWAAPQQHDHDSHTEHSHGAENTDTGYGHVMTVSALARQQLDNARNSIMTRYSSPEEAEAAGWRRPRSSTPTMGEHWTNPGLMREQGVDPLRPEILMFAPINGSLTLVGASWVNRQEADAPLPELFDGMDAMWHRHDASDPLNRAGAAASSALGQNARQRASGIVMNHLWFIDAPQGEFTGHNHWLPFMDADLPIPPQSVGGETLGKAALGIAEVNDSAFIINSYYTLLPADARSEVDMHREEIATLMASYRAAAAADYLNHMETSLKSIGDHWQQIRAVHSRELQPEVANLLDVAYGNMLAAEQHGPDGH